jgi:hypothetical protein
VTEILTESFCERCGTRYTFESAAPRRSRLGKVRTLSKGMKNFVLSDDASFSEAMAEARSEEEFTAVTHQLDAFHQTFNFCLTCRQYTCGDCWNTPEGRCLTCAPIPGMEEPAFAAAAYPAPTFEDTLPPPYETNGIDPVEAWPDEDLSAARLSRALGLDEAETDATVEAIGEDEEFDLRAATAAAAAVAGAAAIADPDEDRDAVGDVEPSVAEVEPLAAAEDVAPAVFGVAPGQSLEDAVAEYEARMAVEEAVGTEAATASTADELWVDDDLPLAAVADSAPELEPEPVVEVEAETIASAIAAAALVAAVQHEAVAPPEVAPAAAAEPVEEPDHGLAAAALAGLAAAAAAVDRDEEHVEHAPAAAAAAPAPEVAAEPEPVVAAEPELESELEPAPELEPVAAEPEPVAPLAAEPEPEPVAAEPARDDVVTQPTWPQPTPSHGVDVPVVPTPDQPATPAPAPWLTVAPENADEPQWPVAPAFPSPTVRRDMPTTLAGRPLVPQADPSGLWAASAREVLTGAAQVPVQAAAPAPTAQPCVSCGLSLSANARFCRRCGTRQG